MRNPAFATLTFFALACTSSLAGPASAKGSDCASIESCTEHLFDRPWEHGLQQSAAERLSGMERDAVIGSLAERTALGEGNRWVIAFRWMDEAVPGLREDLVWRWLRQGDTEALLAAGRLLRAQDEDTVRERIKALLPAERQALEARLLDGISSRHDGAAGLALLMDESERSNVLATFLPMQRTGNARKAFEILFATDPARADAFIRPRLIDAQTPRYYLKHYGGGEYALDPINYAWIDRVWRDGALPDKVRDDALAMLIDPDNPALPAWTPMIATRVEANPRVVSLFRLMALYGNDALEVAESEWSKADWRGRSHILNALSRADSLDTTRVVPMVAQGLARNDDFEVQEAAVRAWRRLRLNELDTQAQAVVARSPFDRVRFAARPDSDEDAHHGGRFSASKLRDPTNYCERGTAVLDLDKAMARAREVGIGDEQRVVNGISASAVTSTYEQAGATYLGYDRGEFGGGLVQVGVNGVQAKALNENVTFIGPVDTLSGGTADGPAWVFVGLNHMFPRGALYRLEAGDVSHVMKLPSAVLGLARDGGDYIMSFHNPKDEAERWLFYHPPIRLSPDGTLSPACNTAR